MQRALHALFNLINQVVAQIIEAKFVVGTVGDVGLVCGNFIRALHLRQIDTDRQAEEVIQASHPLRIATRQVIIDRDDVNAFARDRVEVNGKRTHQGFTFTGTHLSDFTFVQYHAADHLDIEVAHPQDTLRRFAHNCKRLDLQLVQRSASLILFFKLKRLTA